MRHALTIALLCCAAASAQIVQVQGGASSLLSATGGSAALYFPTSTITVGAGCTPSGCGFGMSDTFVWHGFNVTAGDESFAASVDGGGIGINERGLAISKTDSKQSLAAFLGSTGTSFSAPFFQTGHSQHVGAGLVYRRHHGPWALQSFAVLSGGQRSAAASARYQSERVGFTGAGGVLQNNPFLNGEFDVAAIKQHLIFSAARQTLYYPAAPTVTANSVSAFGNVSRFSFHAGALEGTASGKSSNGATVGGGVQLGPVLAQTSYFATAKQHMLVTMVAETLHRHWTATQSISGGQFAFGGTYMSNRATLSVGHAVMFFPLGGRGFQQVTTVQISFHIPHRCHCQREHQLSTQRARAVHRLRHNICTWPIARLSDDGAPQPQQRR
jgi:hypothetical protein